MCQTVGLYLFKPLDLLQPPKPTYCHLDYEKWMHTRCVLGEVWTTDNPETRPHLGLTLQELLERKPREQWPAAGAWEKKLRQVGDLGAINSSGGCSQGWLCRALRAQDGCRMSLSPKWRQGTLTQVVVKHLTRTTSCNSTDYNPYNTTCINL